MGKPKTSERQEKFLDTFKPIRLKKGVRLKDHHPELRLRDRKLVTLALVECLLDGDHEAFKEVLRAHLEAINKDELSKRSGVSRTTLFRMLSPGSNPTLKNVTKIIQTLKSV